MYEISVTGGFWRLVPCVYVLISGQEFYGDV